MMPTTNYVVMDLEDYDAQDEEGGVTWSLTGTDRRDFAISADGVVTFAKTPNYEEPEDSGGNNVYEFRVVATDVQSGSSRRNVSVSDVTVTVGDVEEDGTLTVDNLSPAAGQTVTFRLTDPDGSIVTTSTADITWVIQSLASGGSWARVSGVLTPASTTFPWVVDEDVTGKAIRAMVTYTDRRGSGKTALSQQTAEVTADPIANAPPRFRGVSSWSVEEGPAGGAVGTPTSATDRDNDTLTYGIEASLDSALFEIDPSTGQVRLAQALDFETMSEPRVLFIYLTLHDGRDADGNAETVPTVDARRSADVSVVDVEEDGVVTLSAVEPETGTPLTATLEDGDGGVTGEIWQWARSENGRTGWTNISGATSSSYTPTVADEDFYLRATVTYTDRRGGKSAEAVTDDPVPSANRRPRFPSTETGERTVPENSRAGRNIGVPVAADDPENNRLTYTLTGTDADAFTIVTSTGQIRTSEALDFETKPSYTVTVEVHDGRDGMGNTSTTIDDTQAVTITVENEEEPGTITLTTPTGTIQARAEVTAALEDDDIPTGVTWQWARSPNGRTLWVNIQGATLAAYTPTLEEDRGSYIRATASYTDGQGPNKTAEKVSARVGDPPPVNSAPVFPSTERRAARGGGELRGRYGSRNPGGGDRPERRGLGGQRPAGLLIERDERSVVHHRCEHRPDQAGAGRDAGLRGQAVVPRHRGSHRRQGPERRRRHGRDRRQAERDHHRDERQRGAGGVRRRVAQCRGKPGPRGRDLHRRGPGARHAHLVGQRQRFLDLQPGPAALPHPAQPRGRPDLHGNGYGNRRRRRRQSVRLAQRDRHRDGRRGGGSGSHPPRREAGWTRRRSSPPS